jgi:lipopolysaccharide export system permease protein
MTLFLLASLTYLVSIANMTSVLKITHYDFMQLYIYAIPRILIYTLPITFFVALASSLSNMSKDNESIIFFTLGLRPWVIARFLMLLAAIVSILTLINVIVFIPKVDQFNKQLMAKKRAEASLNIKATEFGQQFGNWYIFVKENREIKEMNGSKELEKMILFEHGSDGEKFILSDHAFVTNKEGSINLDLRDGSAFIIKNDELTKIDFRQMKMNDYSELKDFKNESTLMYWKRVLKEKSTRKNFIVNIGLGLFPLVSFLIAMSVGIFNRRYDKRLFSLYLFLAILLYTATIYSLSTKISFWTLALIPSLYAVASYLIYKKSILARY